MKSGFTPWFFAVRNGRIEVVKTLLETGIGVNEVMQTPRVGGRRATLSSGRCASGR